MFVCLLAMSETDQQRPAAPRRRDVRRRFDRAAAGFDEADFVHRVTGEGLLERLAPVRLEAGRVLELGSATGTLSRQLAKRFRRCQVLSLDLSHAMLARARRKRWRFARISELQASADALPLPAHSVDAIVANLLLPFIGEPERLLAEVARVLRPDGLFAFAALGPDSLVELRDAFAADGELHVFEFTDMHDVGDAMLRAGLRDPVLDVDRLQLSYRDTAALYRDLTACGARNTLAGRRGTLTGRARFRRADRALGRRARDGRLEVTLELTYGHAWGGQAAAADGRAGEFRVPLGKVSRRRR